MNVEQALSVAYNGHYGQVRKFSGEPYIFHSIRVYEAVKHHGEDIAVGALLHDVLEDTGYKMKYLQNRGLNVTQYGILTLLTRDPTWTYEEYLQRILTQYEASVIKLADSKDNLSTLPEGNKLKGRYMKNILTITNNMLDKGWSW